MKIDVDQAMAVAEVQFKAMSWDLSLTIGGNEYRVRPIKNEDVAAIAAAQGTKDMDQVRGLVLGLLVEPPANPALFSDEQIVTALAAIMIGFAQHVKKKSPILERAILASSTPSPSGS
jgi:hypothetical protein